jgi:hypothetical protein
MPGRGSTKERRANPAGAWIDSTVTYLADRSIPPVWHGSGTADARDWHEGRYGAFPVRIHDLRPLAEDLSLDRNGFLLTRHGSAVRDFDDLDEIHEVYVPEMEALIMGLTGASRAIVLGPAVREASARMPVQRPFHRVHSDFTDQNGPEWARALLTEGNTAGRVTTPRVSREEADAILRRRYAEYNVWQPIDGPVRREPLGLVDASTIGPDDVMTCTSEAGDILFGVYNPAHRWYYAPEMGIDEVLIFKCYESARDGRARFTLHSAFADADTPSDAPMRRNIEARVFAFFDA